MLPNSALLTDAHYFALRAVRQDANVIFNKWMRASNEE